ncbi:MAG: DUF1993 domain-containing protein [Pseudomonadota bacterium]
MTISMFDLSAPLFDRNLSYLSHVLKKGAAHAAATGMDEAALIDARMAPDMFDFKRQVQTVTDHCKGALSRLTETTPPSWADDETSFDALQARIAKARDFGAGFTRAQLDGTEEVRVEYPGPAGPIPFSGSDYLVNFVHPNLYFHLTTAYVILRYHGVPLGKLDFFGRG